MLITRCESLLNLYDKRIELKQPVYNIPKSYMCTLNSVFFFTIPCRRCTCIWVCTQYLVEYGCCRNSNWIFDLFCKYQCFVHNRIYCLIIHEITCCQLQCLGDKGFSYKVNLDELVTFWARDSVCLVILQKQQHILTKQENAVIYFL